MSGLTWVKFERLNPFKVREVLLVSSPFDRFVLEENDILPMTLHRDFEQLISSQAPRISHASDADDALNLMQERRFDLVITMSRIGSMNVNEFGMKMKSIHPEIPVVLLTYNTRELAHLKIGGGIDRVFVWSGDTSILFAIISLIEDERNVGHDVEFGDVQVMVLVEDSPRFYSKYLTRFYKNLARQTSRLIYGGLNAHHKMLRLRSRAKVLLATNYEDALDAVRKYGRNIIGLFTDGRFPRKNEMQEDSGLKLMDEVRDLYPHLPILFMSTEEHNRIPSEEKGAVYINKHDRQLHAKINQFMASRMGFGDFIFSDSENNQYMSASNLNELRDGIEQIPEKSLLYHAERNHFSHWLRTRTEFEVAAAIREKKINDFPSSDGVRNFMIESIQTFLRMQRRQTIFDYNPELAHSSNFQRLGKGSLGGKGRGLAFCFSRIHELELHSKYPEVRIDVPRTLILATDRFVSFLERNNLSEIALSEADDDEISEAFLKGEFSDEDLKIMKGMLEIVTWPIAVRSSSMLEDALHQPFAGVYSTFMLPNDHPSLDCRVKHLSQSIKLVYASTFFKKAKQYVAATPNSIEEERMAVVIQEIVGTKKENLFYPTVSGVARSHNHYPVGDIKSSDGLAAIAFGLGRTVAEGEKCLRVSPAHPHRVHQFSNVTSTFNSSQRKFWAVQLNKFDGDITSDPNLTMHHAEINEAISHGQLDLLASTYISQDDRIVHSIHREGPKLLTMHGIREKKKSPLMPLLSEILEKLETRLSTPVEIEFAYAFCQELGIHRFALLQMRPLVSDGVDVNYDKSEIDESQILLQTKQALGNGVIPDIRDVIYVNPEKLDRLRTQDLVKIIEKMNSQLLNENRPYLLIGPGRWGSSDSSFGIPVSWSQISGAAAIVECEMIDIKVEPSQGTHFFQNIVSFGVGYLTVSDTDPSVDFEWLESQPSVEKYGPLCHLRLEEDLPILIDSKNQQAVILKPSI